MSAKVPSKQGGRGVNARNNGVRVSRNDGGGRRPQRAPSNAARVDRVVNRKRESGDICLGNQGSSRTRPIDSQKRRHKVRRPNVVVLNDRRPKVPDVVIVEASGPEIKFTDGDGSSGGKAAAIAVLIIGIALTILGICIFPVEPVAGLVFGFVGVTMAIGGGIALN